MMLLLGAQLSIESGGTAHPERFTPVMVISTLTMTHAWIPGVVSPNMPSWSIAAEFFAYLLFPMLIVVISRLRRSGAALFIAAGVALAVTYDALLPHDSALIRVMAGFLVGMGAFRLGPIELPGMLRRWGGLLAVALVVIWASGSATPSLHIGVVLFAVLIVLVRGSGDVTGRFLALPPLVYLGEVSYSLYMVHWPVRAVLRQAYVSTGLLDAVHPGLIVLSYWVVSILAAIAMYHVIEQPGRRWVRALAVRPDRSRRVVPVPAPAKLEEG
jgi:peptidoglycan/LPS O-acetylase OafA/YrhL